MDELAWRDTGHYGQPLPPPHHAIYRSSERAYRMLGTSITLLDL